LLYFAVKKKCRFYKKKKAIDVFSNHTLIKYSIGHTPYLEIPEKFKFDLFQFIENNGDFQ